MDLDEMKQTWSLMNEQLAQQELINKQLIRGMTKEQSLNRFNRILWMEAVNHIINWGLLVVILLRGSFDSFLLKGCLGLFTLMALALSILSYQFVQQLKEIDIQRNTLVTTLSQMCNLKQAYYQYKKRALGTMLISIFPVMLLVVKMVHHKNLLESLDIFGIPLVVGSVIGFGIAYWIYNNIYEKNLEEVTLLLQDLERVGA
jgi:hypothetical protein